MPYIFSSPSRRLSGEFVAQDFPVPYSSLPVVLRSANTGMSGQFVPAPDAVGSLGRHYGAGAGRRTPVLSGGFVESEWVDPPFYTGAPQAPLGAFADDFAGFVDRNKLPILAVGVGLLLFAGGRRRKLF